MSDIKNRFGAAASKEKKKAGGLPEEISAGLNEKPNTIPEPVIEPPVQKTSEEPAPKVSQEENSVARAGLVETYEAQQRYQEPRSVRFQAVITPTLNSRLNDLVNEKKIKSRNDLINYLLERYLAEIE